MIEIEDYYVQLPGGRCYQKGGARLEKAVYNCIPQYLKKNIKLNLRPKKNNGDVIVEYDMLYINNNQMVSIEVKGLNDKTSNCPDRQLKLFNQAIRQKQFLDETFTKKNIKIGVFFCFVTGKNSLPPNKDFITTLEDNDITVCIGETPNDAIKNAINMLKNKGFLTHNYSNNISVCNCIHTDVQIIKSHKLTYLDIIKKKPINIPLD